MVYKSTCIWGAPSCTASYFYFFPFRECHFGAWETMWGWFLHTQNGDDDCWAWGRHWVHPTRPIGWINTIKCSEYHGSTANSSNYHCRKCTETLGCKSAQKHTYRWMDGIGWDGIGWDGIHVCVCMYRSARILAEAQHPTNKTPCKKSNTRKIKI